MICEYGCNREAKFQFKNKKWCCENNTAKCLGNIEKLKQRFKTQGHPTSGVIAWNKGLSKETDKRVNKNTEGIKRNYIGKDKSELKGCCNPKYFKTEKYKIQLTKTGGYRKNSGRGKGSYVIDSFGNKTWLQSTYETRCSEFLNELNIKWIRPEPLYYLRGSKKFKYYPDFFLPEFNIYLDPKNDYLVKIDKEKIELVVNQNEVKIYILTNDLINKEYLKSLIGI